MTNKFNYFSSTNIPLGIHFVLVVFAMYKLKSLIVDFSSFFCIFLLLCGGCQVPEKPLFTRLTETTGISFRNEIVPTPDLRIMTYPYFYNGGGVAAGDLNNDGLVELFFTANQKDDQLYLNHGDLQFNNVSQKAGIKNDGEWHSGVNMVDINADGLLDIYICTVSGIAGLHGHNRLYINEGDLSFSEQSSSYGLDFSGLSTQAAFFDFDRDGDLDCYLLNHAAHDAFSSYTLRAKHVQNELLGDRFYVNENGFFRNASSELGIIQAYNGFGLGVTVSDFNNDQWLDIYVCNDFLEDDFLYLNQQGLKFKESLHKMVGHSSKFSMGTDAADINNDGYPDLVTLDMKSSDEKVIKTSTGEDPPQVYEYKMSQGYLHQYAQNCLQLNMGGMRFADVGTFAGIEATDWSWGALVADYDLDGRKDIFISNGIPHRPNNYDFVNYIYSQVSSNTTTQDFHQIWDKATSLMPDGAMHNYIYRNLGNLTFADKSQEWGFDKYDYCNGTAYVDLDNDGDLDLVANQLNDNASIWRNNTTEKDYLRLKLKGTGANTHALGAKVYVWQKGTFQFQELINVRGFQSSVDYTLNFGLGLPSPIDSVVVQWPDGGRQGIRQVRKNETLVVSQDIGRRGTNYSKIQQDGENTLLVRNTSAVFRHKQDPQTDFLKNSLQIFDLAKVGPALAAGDINGDGLDDLFIGGASTFIGTIWIQQTNGLFAELPQPILENDAICEDSDAVFFDADLDGDLDLYVASGGNQVREYLVDRLYVNNGSGSFTVGQRSLPPLAVNTACIRPADFDQDGDQDLFVGGRNIKDKYGMIPKSFLLENREGVFVDVTAERSPDLLNAGMVTDATWVDYNGDKTLDLLVVGEWMAPTIFENRKHAFTKQSTGNENIGLWTSIGHCDIDADGDEDLFLGNMGLNNTIYGPDASDLKMYLVSQGESLLPILCYRIGLDYYPVHSKNELTSVFPELAKRFNHFRDFAGKPAEAVFGEMLLNAEVRTANQFASMYLENTGNAFVQHLLPPEVQISNINAFCFTDINHDGHQDVILAGNNYNIVYTQVRNDAGFGAILLGDGKGNFEVLPPPISGLWADGHVNKIALLNDVSGNIAHIAIARNDADLSLFTMSATPPITFN